MTQVFNRQCEDEAAVSVETQTEALLVISKWHEELSNNFCAELLDASGNRLLVGFGSKHFVQFTGGEDGATPLAVVGNPTLDSDQAYIEFLIGGTPTPISQRYLVPLSILAAAIESFLEDGCPSTQLEWEII